MCIMNKTRSVSKSKNRGDGLGTKRFMTGATAPWSDLDPHLLYLVMMQLGAFDFFAFSGVCKSWRSLALSNKIRFMSSRPTMSIWIIEQGNKREYSMNDFDGREFKFRIPKSSGKTCVGLTCGYLVLFGLKPREFWLMNPITRHGFRFPKVPRDLEPNRDGIRAILVFSPSISAWVLVVFRRFLSEIWFSIAGKGSWSYVSSEEGFFDLHEFKGKIYAIDTDACLYELGLDPDPKLTLLKIKNVLDPDLRLPEIVCSGENFYFMENFWEYVYVVHELDFDEMKWVSPNENTMDEYAFFVSELKHSAAIKRELWSDSWLPYYKKYGFRYISRNGMFFNKDIWYFPHDCLKVNLKHEKRPNHENLDEWCQ
uniref:F-box domain-containing protein n=1 Tax=Lactuca sativa TaxID=4236 RepID=A0A9R1VZ44_LACSA|nr:hypothetical protein LSAT_V11C400174390 [Lactuca sativa]